MNLLSILILAGIIIWFVVAVIYLVRRKGSSCGCSGTSMCSCSKDCASCQEKCGRIDGEVL